MSFVCKGLFWFAYKSLSILQLPGYLSCPFFFFFNIANPAQFCGQTMDGH